MVEYVPFTISLFQQQKGIMTDKHLSPILSVALDLCNDQNSEKTRLHFA